LARIALSPFTVLVNINGHVRSQLCDQVKINVISAQNLARIPRPRKCFLVVIKCYDSDRCHLGCEDCQDLTAHTRKSRAQ
jgi:hypothetical protein